MKNDSLLKNAFCVFILLINLHSAAAQSSSRNFWSKIETQKNFTKRTWYPDQYRLFGLRQEALKNFLSSAPSEATVTAHSSLFVIELPMPDGNFHRYSMVESPVMAPGLASAYPFIKTYSGQGIDDRTATIRFDITPAGFHAYVLSAHGTVYIDPAERGNTEDYIVYYKHDIPSGLSAFNCLVESDEDESELNNQHNRIYQPTATVMNIGAELRTYRLALAANFEYTTYHGGTIAGALAAMVTTINRVNGMYERELGIRMVLVPNDTLLIFTTSTDPYTNTSGSAMLTQNQSTCDNTILVANYDIGHVFSTDGGGVASLGCVCGSNKARGTTGSFDPVGDPFDIDYVAHEMGHQFGANHSFNSGTGSCGGNRSSTSAYEPGSASTIMGYAGLCSSNDLQPNSDAYFHTRNFDAIVTYSQTGAGNNCAVITTTGNNPPVLTIPSSTYTIPYQTPFKLTASATDPDGDVVTYCWEQYDLGPSGNWNSPSGNAPLFRSFSPTLSPTRLFPQLSTILNNTTYIGEIKPTYNRSLNFRCTARDNRSGGGGVIHSPTTMNLVVDSTGIPFAITYPNVSGITWTTGAIDSVTWNVGFTDVAPINTPFVNIYFSADNGQSFPTLLGANVPNTGSYSFMVPGIATTLGRIMVEGAGNVFFDINNRPLSILDPMSVSENYLNTAISLYPNPSGDAVHFLINTIRRGKCRIVLNDVAGRTMQETVIEKNSGAIDLDLDLSAIAKGMYIVRFELPEGTVQKKLVKE